MIHLLWIMLAFGLVLLNAFFVAAEFGMVKLRHTRVAAIKTTHGLRGQILAQVHSHLDAYLSACQLGITLASLGLGWIGEPTFAYLFSSVFQFFGIHSPELLKITAFIAAFSLISFLHIVVGELMPKSLAIRQSEFVSLWTAIPLYVFYWLMYPAIWILNTCSNFLLKISGLNSTHQKEFSYSSDEIKLILGASQLHGELKQEEREIIEHTLDFADLHVTEVMRPQEKMISLNIHQPFLELLKTALEHRYSRYPVYDKDPDNIIGIIHVKDLFTIFHSHIQSDSDTAKYSDQMDHRQWDTSKLFEQQIPLIHISNLVRPIIRVSHALPTLKLLEKFREGVSHFALVYSRKERLIGFITLDNLLHILLGRIQDEFHKTKDDWINYADGSLSIRGDCSIYSLERALNQDIKLMADEHEIDTLGGLILKRLDRLPKTKERIEFSEFDAVIKKIRGIKIQKILIYPKIHKNI